jgi:hypothetical protein
VWETRTITTILNEERREDVCVLRGYKCRACGCLYNMGMTCRAKPSKEYVKRQMLDVVASQTYADVAKNAEILKDPDKRIPFFQDLFRKDAVFGSDPEKPKGE